MPDTPPPTPEKPSEVLKEPLLALLKRLTATEWAFLAGVASLIGAAGYGLYPYRNPPKPCPEAAYPCPTSETIDRDCRGLQDSGVMKVNAQRCLQLATDAQLCKNPDLVLNLMDLSCQNGNAEACREFHLIHPGPPPCDPPPQRSSRSSRQTPTTQAPAQSVLAPTAAPRAGRHLDDAEKRKLTQELAKFPGKTVNVIVMGGDREALFYGREIYRWLKQAGYPLKAKNEDELDTTSGSQLVGEKVYPDEGTIAVEIGFQDVSKD